MSSRLPTKVLFAPNGRRSRAQRQLTEYSNGSVGKAKPASVSGSGLAGFVELPRQLAGSFGFIGFRDPRIQLGSECWNRLEIRMIDKPASVVLDDDVGSEGLLELGDNVRILRLTRFCDLGLGVD